MTATVTTDKGKQEIELPISWYDDNLNTDQYQQIVRDWDKKDLVKLFSILSGIEYRTLSNMHDPRLEEALIESTRFVYEEPFDFQDKDLPTSIRINDRVLMIPKDLKSLSVGQNIHVRQRLETAKVYEELISFVTAIYLQPIYDNSEFDFHSAMQLEAEILKMPAYMTYPVGVFFLRKLQKSGTASTRGLSLLKTLFRNVFTRKGKTSRSKPVYQRSSNTSTE